MVQFYASNDETYYPVQLSLNLNANAVCFPHNWLAEIALSQQIAQAPLQVMVAH